MKTHDISFQNITWGLALGMISTTKAQKTRKVLKMKNQKLTEAKKQKLLLEELSNWMQGNDYNGGLEFAFNNGFTLHALSCWQSTGASQYDFSVRINRKKEMKEIKELCAYADIFICEHCNHHSFFSPGEIEEDETECESCCKIMKIDSRGK